MMICHESEIQLSHLPPAVLNDSKPVSQPANYSSNITSQNLVEAVEQFERHIILEALAKCDWNKSKAARDLGVTRRILSYKMNNLGIDKGPLSDRRAAPVNSRCNSEIS